MAMFDLNVDINHADADADSSCAQKGVQLQSIPPEISDSRTSNSSVWNPAEEDSSNNSSPLIFGILKKEKYGSDAEEDDVDDDEEDSEEAESEDEDGEELTPAVDAAILRTLARIRRKDPEIYQEGKDVFDGTESDCLYSISPPHRVLEEIQRSGDLKLSSRSRKTKVSF